MKEATSRVIGVTDMTGYVVASTELSLIGSTIPGAALLAERGGEAAIAGRTMRLVGGIQKPDYAVFVEGTDNEARSLCIMAAIALAEAKTFYEEKHDRAALVKSIITDNILPGDVYVHAKELNFAADTTRAIYLIRQVGRADVAVVEFLQRMFPERQRDFVLSISETDVAVVREVPAASEASDLHKVAERIQRALFDEMNINTVIGIGSTAKHIRELADRYKEAQNAIEVGKVFDPDQTILNYENLGIGRLIYQLPTTLCEMFLSEVFQKNPIDELDDETLGIINKFFDNSLNISETSRKLFVHRNTLVYRLGKIKKQTGLDLREFDQAIVFKVALMVKQYLSSKKNLAN